MTDPSPPSPWSASAIARAVQIHLFGLEGGLVRRAGRLLRRPGQTVRHALDRERDVFAEPLRLFLLANLAFFVVGPSIGLLAFTLDSLAAAPGYAEAVESQIRRLGMDLDLYRERFNSGFRFRQPTFVILLVLPLAASSRLMLRREPLGRHLVVALLFLAWVLLAWPMIRGAGLGLAAVIPAAANLFDAAAVGVLLGTTWAVARVIWARGFDLGGARSWAAGAATTAVLLGAIAAYGHLIFWVTFVLMEWGG